MASCETAAAVALAVLPACVSFAEGREARRFFTIKVVDAATGRGVPLVELRTVSGVRHWTDSAGVVAFDEPGLTGREVFFSVKSHGYEELPKDGFGCRGVKLRPVPGGSARIEIKRGNIAERLYRTTGGGIYRDSVLAGLPVPLREPVLNGKVVGQDSVQMAEYRGRLYWLWGDTNKPSYPLGHFGTSGATSIKPGAGSGAAKGLDPSVGVDLTYFTGRGGFSRPMCGVPGPGMKWMDGLVTVPDEKGRERLVARFVRMKSLGEEHQRGLVIFNDDAEKFELLSRLGPGDLKFPCCHAFRHRRGRSGRDAEHVYFAYPYPNVRVKADLESFRDPRRYEALTCLEPRARFARGDSKLERDGNGRLVWAWKADAAPLTDGQWEKLVEAGKAKPEEAWNRLVDANSGERVRAHNGSVAFNRFRRRWIMIFGQEHGGPSYLGEIWYAEAKALEGPWRKATKIVTHDRYSFYNVKHHPLFDQKGGRLIYFEGTYTATFSGNDDKTPRYDYNQIMYRLDLGDPRLDVAGGVPGPATVNHSSSAFLSGHVAKAGAGARRRTRMHTDGRLAGTCSGRR